MLKTSNKSIFQFILIKPSHYGEEGYVIQWMRSAVPSNTLAVLNGLALDCADRGVLGENVELVVSSYDESNTRIRPKKIARLIKKTGGKGLVGFVGINKEGRTS